MEELFVSNTVYGATKAAPTVANGATSPDLLANGSVGIYSVGSATGKPVLLTAAATGVVSELNLIFAQGTASGCIVSKSVKPAWLKSFHGAEYTPAIKQVSFLGFNGVSGTLGVNFATLTDYTDAGVQVISRLGQANPEDDYTTSSGYLLASDNIYTVAGKVSPAVNADARVRAYVITNPTVGAVTATAASGVVFINGSAIVTGITAGITAANYLTITIDPQTGLVVPIATANSISNTYRVSAVGASTITLDRGFAGTSQTVTAAAFNAATTSGVTIPTSVGIAFVSNFSPYQTFEVLGEGAFINATRTLPSTGSPAVGMFPGAGTVDQLKALELRYQYNSGFWATADQWLRQQWTSQVVAGVGYDLYLLKFATVANAYGANEDRVTNEYTLSLAVQDGTTFGNATIGAIMNSISSTTAAPISDFLVEQTGDLNPAG